MRYSSDTSHDPIRQVEINDFPDPVSPIKEMVELSLFAIARSSNSSSAGAGHGGWGYLKGSNK